MAEGMTEAPELAAEQIVLGAALMSGGRSLDDCPLTAADFARPAHGGLWGLLHRTAAEGQPCDPPSIAARLSDDPIPGVTLPYLHTLVASVPTVANAGWYARQVREAADLRAIRAAGTRMAQASGTIEAEAARAFARQTLDALDTRDTGDGSTLLADLLTPVLDGWESKAPAGLSTPWPDLDRHIVGLRPGGLYVVGARPGVGKSVVGLNLAWHVAHRHGKAAVLHSLEMPRDEVVSRLVSAVATIDYTSLSARNLGDREWQRVSTVLGRLSEAPLHVDDRSSLRVSDIRARARRVARTREVGVVVVDYLQLLTPADTRAPREQQVAEMSRSLKLLAKELEVPVVVMAQLNRRVEERADRRPILSDLRESGAVEQDSDVVLLLFRGEESPEVLDVSIGKNRQGPRDGVRLRWDGAYMRVTSLARAS